MLSKNQLVREEYFETLIRILRERRTHPYITSNFEAIFHYSSDEEVHQFLQSHSELQHHKGDLEFSIVGSTSRHTDNRENPALDTTAPRPITYLENALPVLSTFHEYGGNRPTFSLELTQDSESFLVPNAGPRNTQFGNVFVGLQSDLWNQFPYHSAVANLIVPNSSFETFMNAIQISYQHTLPAGGLGRVSINIPKTWDIYQAYFRSMGYEVSPSDKMFYANGLIGLAGGLEKAEILRSPIAHKILDILADKSTPKLARELRRQLSQQGFNLPQSLEGSLEEIISATGIIPSFKRNPRALKNIKDMLESDEKERCLDVLSQLINMKAVQRGLDIKCPYCQTTIWYDIGDLDERIKCRGCLEIFDLPLTESTQDSVDRPFQYSLNPLANRAIDQDILPVITALLALKTVHTQMYHIVPGMNFKQVGSTSNAGDLDFVYVYKHEIYGGECKAGERLTQKDINTARVAGLLGFRTFFFTTTKVFNREAKALINSLQEELISNNNSDHPFSIFSLEQNTLFGREPLPKEISR